MIKLGEKFSFIPTWNIREHDDEETKRRKTVTGKVICVNRAHKQFCVKYHCGGLDAKETFKFTDVGETIFRFGGKRNGR